jgi:hypothetical protein
MDSVGTRVARSDEDGCRIKVAQGRFRRAYEAGLVGSEYMRGVGVGLRVNGDGPDAEDARSADDSKRNFAAIGDQQSLDRARTHDGSEGTISVTSGNRFPAFVFTSRIN